MCSVLNLTLPLSPNAQRNHTESNANGKAAKGAPGSALCNMLLRERSPAHGLTRDSCHLLWCSPTQQRVSGHLFQCNGAQTGANSQDKPWWHKRLFWSRFFSPELVFAELLMHSSQFQFTWSFYQFYLGRAQDKSSCTGYHNMRSR